MFSAPVALKLFVLYKLGMQLPSAASLIFKQVIPSRLCGLCSAGRARARNGAGRSPADRARPRAKSGQNF